ncbi:hypothetical protein [Gordonia soli]|uniref:Lipoprotein n=1 Tax=Gordonia soli NBRC 108243 TaxID=1223545 RepID=M0QNA3_9ACTN|nr:hypothetical protein [Gordonia soli]GAC70058.1 hypothetical protein GS4_32_00020 [Gordonia soli NBRC 108243]
MDGFSRLSGSRRLSGLVSVLVVMAALLAGCGGGDREAPPGAALPGDYPLASVPLLTGTVLTANGSRADGWSVTVQGNREVGDPLDAAVRTLTDAGFTESQRTSDAGQTVVILSGGPKNQTYWVQVGTTPRAAGGPMSVFYQVNTA